MTPRHVVTAVLFGGCAYECAAIASRGRLPTISAMQRRHRALGVAVVAYLAVHFWRYEEPLRRSVPDWTPLDPQEET